MKNRFDGFFERLFMLFMAGLILTGIAMMCWLLYTTAKQLLGGM
jgi:hypothetical protein